MKPAGILLLLLTVTFPTGGARADESVDPAQNRLFWMSTGQIMQSGQASIGLLGAPYLIPWLPYVTFLQGGYAPNSFLQFNATGSIYYWSVGTKVQILQPDGLLLGLAAGVDFGFYPKNAALFSDNQIQALNIAASFGTQEVAGHMNVMQILQSNVPTQVHVPTYVQAGMSLLLDNSPTIRSKFLAELWLVNDYLNKELRMGLILFGVRSFRPKFAWEAAFILGPRISFGGHGSSDDRLQLIPFPYASFMWYI